MIYLRHLPTFQIVFVMVFSMKMLVEIIHRSLKNIRWRRRRSPFLAKHGYSYDVVMVMKVYEAEEKLTKVG